MKTLFRDIFCFYPQRQLCTEREGWGQESGGRHSNTSRRRKAASVVNKSPEAVLSTAHDFPECRT